MERSPMHPLCPTRATRRQPPVAVPGTRTLTPPPPPTANPLPNPVRQPPIEYAKYRG
jgi:hypothetical protein